MNHSYGRSLDRVNHGDGWWRRRADGNGLWNVRKSDGLGDGHRSNRRSLNRVNHSDGRWRWELDCVRDGLGDGNRQRWRGFDGNGLGNMSDRYWMWRRSLDRDWRWNMSDSNGFRNMRNRNGVRWRSFNGHWSWNVSDSDRVTCRDLGHGDAVLFVSLPHREFRLPRVHIRRCSDGWRRLYGMFDDWRSNMLGRRSRRWMLKDRRRRSRMFCGRSRWRRLEKGSLDRRDLVFAANWSGLRDPLDDAKVRCMIIHFQETHLDKREPGGDGQDNRIPHSQNARHRNARQWIKDCENVKVRNVARETAREGR